MVAGDGDADGGDFDGGEGAASGYGHGVDHGSGRGGGDDGVGALGEGGVWGHSHSPEWDGFPVAVHVGEGEVLECAEDEAAGA